MGDLELSKMLKIKIEKINKQEKLEKIINEIDEIIKPKEEEITFQDVNNLIDLFLEIKEDEALYTFASQKYPIKIGALDKLLLEEVKISELSTLINDNTIWDNEITIEIDREINVDELIYLNYLYNIVVNSLLENKEVKIKLLKKEKTKNLVK